MDLMTLLGWILSVLVIIFGIVVSMATGPDGGMVVEILWKNLPSFLDVPSIIITIGGTIVALMTAFPASAFTKIPKHLKIMLFPSKFDPNVYIDQLVEFAKEARINGLLALEDKLGAVEDDFLRESLMLVVDSVEPEKVRSLLETELDYLDARHTQDRALYDRGSQFAPAFGMIGTLIGLVNLLGSLSDPDAIAPAMAVALITTLYGSILANLVFVPLSSKLSIRHDEEYLCKMIICEGVQAIQAGDNPRFIEEKLRQLLPRYKTRGRGSVGSEETPQKGKGKKGR